MPDTMSFYTSISSFLPQINLPWIITFHSSSLVAIGAYNLFGKGPIRPAPHTREDEYRTTVGSTFLTLGLAYLLTSYMPLEENQFLYASVPIRVLTSVVLASTWARNRETMSDEGKWEYLGTALYDGAITVWLGWYLGTFSGRVPRYQ